MQFLCHATSIKVRASVWALIKLDRFLGEQDFMAQAAFTGQLATDLEMTDAVNTSMGQIPDLSLASACTCGQHQSQMAELTDVAQATANNLSVHQPDDLLAPTNDLLAPAQEPDSVLDFGATPATTVGTSGFQNTDALIRGLKWVDPDLTYSFPDTWAGDYPTSYPVGSSTATFNQATAGQQAVFVYWADQFAAVSGLSFSELDGATGALDEDQEATIKMAYDPSVAGTAFAYYPSSSNVGGDIWLGNTAINPTLGTYSHHQIGHELGHAVGLKHGHETTPNGAITAADDSIEYSIMTYRSFAGHNLSTYPFYTSQGYSQTLMSYDITALQFIYGANFNTNSGDTTYTFSTTTGAMSINGVSQGNPFYNEVFRTLWDGDGIDTYDLSNYITDLILDLAPGSYSEFDAGGNFQRTDLGRFGPGAGVEMARGHLFNALQYQGDARSLIENAIGGSGDDTISGNAIANVLTGNDGDDSLKGLGGDDTLLGGTGSDTLSGGGGADSLDGGTGNDQLSGWDGADFLNGGAGIDTLLGEAGDDLLIGGAAGDSINGGSGSDTASYSNSNASVAIDLGAGTTAGGHATGDTLTSIEDLFGSAFSDTLTGDNGDNVINGFSGDDIIDGGAGNDSMEGGQGNDFFISGLGADTINGGAGASDTADYSGSNAAVNIGINAGAVNSGGHAQGDVISTITENLIGSMFDDVITGNTLANLLNGFFGDDTMNASNGNDTLIGGSGDDLLFGSRGADLINGGVGNDTASYGNTDNSVIVDLTAGSGIGSGHASGDTLISIENIIGGQFNDTLTGDNGANSLSGLAGNDLLNGLGGNDTLLGSNGADTLNGGSGDDLLTGSGGADSFVFDTASFGNDTIIGFANGLELLDFQGSGLAYTDLTITTGATDTTISVTASPTNQITLSGVTSLIDANDFLF